MGWSDLVVAPAGQSPTGAHRQASTRANLVRQLKSALQSLARDEVRLVALANAASARNKYEGFVLLDEAGSAGRPHDVPYRVPRAQEAALDIPAGFFLKGWCHVLNDSEILAFLMLSELRRIDPRRHDAEGVDIGGAQRIRSFGLSKDTYECLSSLGAFGLVDVERDPQRRDDGTFEGFGDGEVPRRNRYRIVDSGLDASAVTTVEKALRETL